MNKYCLILIFLCIYCPISNAQIYTSEIKVDSSYQNNTTVSGNLNVGTINDNLQINDPGEGIIFSGNTSGDKKLYIVDDANDNILKLESNSSTSQLFEVINNGTGTAFIRTTLGSGYGIVGSRSSGGYFQAYNSSGIRNVEILSYGDSYFKGGKVGINTDSPNGLLDVRGTAYFGASSGTQLKIYKGHITQEFGAALIVETLGTAADILFRTGNGEEMRIDAATQKVGIGFTSPSYKLKVDGTVRATTFSAENPQWSDFVFDLHYKLPSLDELEIYIQTNRHLPDIPTEKEVAKNGVDFVKMNSLLLQKVEELTLHIIELHKRIEILENSPPK